jgi:hypothetical protein
MRKIVYNDDRVKSTTLRFAGPALYKQRYSERLARHPADAFHARGR